MVSEARVRGWEKRRAKYGPSGQPAGYKWTGRTGPRPKPSDGITDDQYRERLKAKCILDPMTGCWLYQGWKRDSGYGEMSYRAENWGTHRLAYRLWKGEIPVDKEIMHKCDVRHCCNPDHLEPGTHHKNLLDKLEKDRQPKKYKPRPSGQGQGNKNKSHCVHGHPLVGENLYITSDGRRRCRTCHHRHVREHTERYSSTSTAEHMK